MRRLAPRPLTGALDLVARRAAPATTLARVQEAWPEAVGAVVAAEAGPVSERAGTVTVACRSAVWAQELELLSVSLLGRLNGRLGGQGAAGAVQGMRFVVAGSVDPGPGRARRRPRG